MNKMSYTRFCECMIRYLSGKLPADGDVPPVSLRSFDDENGRRDVLFISCGRSEGPYHPGAELHSLYEEYLHGWEVEQLGNIVCSSCMPLGNDYFLEHIRDYEYARNNMFIRVRGMKAAERLLSGSPYQRIEDLVLTYHIRLSEKSDSLSSVMISGGIMEEFSVSPGRLQQDALRSAMRIYPAVIRKMSDILDDDECLPAGKPVFVVTNSYGMNGASALFYPGVMEQTARMAGGDFYALPSSIHEFVIVPDQEGTSAEHLAAMVPAINRSMVSPDEVLSDSVYHYSHESGVFELAQKYAERREDPGRS